MALTVSAAFSRWSFQVSHTATYSKFVSLMCFFISFMCVPTPRLPQPSCATRMRSFAPIERMRSAAVSGFFQATAAAAARPEVLMKSRRLSDGVVFSEVGEFMVKVFSAVGRGLPPTSQALKPDVQLYGYATRI